MKECPICHAKNGDGSETCYNCHASLNFKVYNAYNNQNKNQGNVSNKSNNTQNMQVNDTPNKGRGKDFLYSILGYGIWGAIMLVLNFLIIFPFYMMGLPFWLAIICFIAILILNDVISGAIQLISWIVGLIFTILAPQDWLSIVYYIAFVIVELPTIIRLVKAIKLKFY